MSHVMRIDEKMASDIPFGRLTLALFSLCILFLLLTPAGAGAEDPCSGSFDVTVQGINPSYKPGENISGTAAFSLSNDSQCPGCRQQVLVGIADQYGKGYDAVCVYDATPRACPAATAGNVQFTLAAPYEPGIYTIMVSNPQHNSCEMALRSFAGEIVQGREIAVIQVVDLASVASIPKAPRATAMDTLGSWSRRYFPFIIILAVLAVGTGLMISRKRAKRVKGKGLSLKAELGIISAATIALAVTAAVVFRDQIIASIIEIAVNIYFLL